LDIMTPGYKFGGEPDDALILIDSLSDTRVMRLDDFCKRFNEINLEDMNNAEKTKTSPK